MTGREGEPCARAQTVGSAQSPQSSEIADQLGHAPTETLKDYAHVMREYRRKEPASAEELIATARRAAEIDHGDNEAVG